MADEILSRDQNHITVLGGITNDSDQDVTMLRVDPITKRLLVSATGVNAGVTSLNTLTGDIILAAGTNITLTPAGNTITISAIDTDTGITRLTGDVTAGPGSGSQIATLATVNSNVGSFGTASSVGTFTVNGKGLVTAALNTSIQIAESQVTNLVSDLAGKQATGNYITALTGDGTASGPGSVAFTLATVNGNVGTFGSATQSTQITVNGKGLITAIANVTITPALGSITGLGTGIATWLATPSSANLLAAQTDKTGTGLLVFGTSPTLTTAVLGSSTATTQTPADNSTKLATTAYVDNAILGQRQKEACKYGSIAALPTVVYANGSSGVGATITAVGFGAISLDSNTPSVGDRVLIKNQASTFQNGIYVVTTVGAVAALFVLTRATDFDQASDIQTGDSVFITAGSTLANTTWAYNGIDSPVMGTDAITFVQAAGPGSYTAGNGISITGVSIAIDTSVTVDKNTAQVLTNKTLTTPVINGLPTGTGVATANTVSTLVSRDGSGNFSAGTITAALTGNASTATALQNARTIGGVSFNGTANITVASATGGFTISGGNLDLSANNLVTDTTTGTKIGTATTQKIGFFNSTPIVKPTGDVATALSNLGLVASPTIIASTNANLTGPITSVGNATSIASQTGTGTKFVVDTSPLIQTNFEVRTATDDNLFVRGHFTLADGVVFQAINNGHSVDRGFEIRASTFDIEASAGVRIGSGVNTKIAGTAVRGTTEGTNHLDIFDGTAPVGTLANGISLYSTAGELRVMDSAGNATLLSPHEKGTNYWIYDSVDSTTGKHLRIDMEKMLKFLNKKFGTDFIKEFYE